MRSQKNMSIRLAVVDGKKVEDTFSRIGRTGEQAFERIERSILPFLQMHHAFIQEVLSGMKYQLSPNKVKPSLRQGR